jgi:hypothetical protein
VLGSVINSQHGCFKYNVSLFKVVYGQVFDHELSCTKEEACQCWMVPQRLQVTNNQEFEAYVQKNCYLGDEEAMEEINDGYFSNGLLPPNKKDKVSDNYFFEHLNDNFSTQEDFFEEEVAEERKSSTASQEELSSSPPIELRTQSPESLCQSQESLFVHPLGETAPLAKESTAMDVCDFVLQEEDTKPLS